MDEKAPIKLRSFEVPSWVPPTVPQEHRAGFNGRRRPCEGEQAFAETCTANLHVSARCFSVVIEDGRTQWRYVCTRCGGEVAGPCAQLRGFTLGSSDELLALKETAAKRAQARKEHENAKAAQEFKSFEHPYHRYLRSDPWVKLRVPRILARDGHKCRVCESTKLLKVHHRSYEHVGDFKGSEPDEDLITLCDQCHQAVHWLNPHEQKHHKDIKAWPGHGKYPPP